MRTLLGYLATWLLGYLATWLLGYLATWLLGYLAELIAEEVRSQPVLIKP